MQKCKRCDRLYVYKRTSGHRKDVCNSCWVNSRRFEIKRKCVEYKGGICIKCGYDRCINALEFHHRNPKTKMFSIGGAHCRSWKNIKKELDKCDLLCANCHREIEYQSEAVLPTDL